jgi:hypothetical protein
MRIRLFTAFSLLWCAGFTLLFVQQDQPAFAAAMGVLLGLWIASAIIELREDT